ncbi:MAG TPA: hypothetical protein VGR88_09980 [Ktedonobacterales bacterium]|nr:hypothetical protein [Ktedonobacterales bacterium]
MKKSIYALLVCGYVAWAQTQIDLRTQSRNVDFSGASSTKPAQTGPALPATCGVGQIFFDTGTAPGSNLYGCTAANTWTAQGGVTSNPNYSKPFASVSSLTIMGTEHLMQTANLLVTCYDAQTPAHVIEPDSVTVDPATYNVAIAFSQPQSGRCVLNGNSVSGSGGGGAVASVFGRTGGVIAQTGDYSFSQISGTATNAQIGAAIDAAKIGAGTVSTSVFGYIANLTSDAQAQITSLTHAGGDLSGDPRNAAVIGLQSRAVSPQAPLNQQALMWNQTANAWQPQTLPVSGAQMAAQLLDFAASLDSTSTVLTIGANCSTATPCNARFGNAVYAITAPAAVTIGSGAAGTAFIYVGMDGSIDAGSSMSVTCSGCNAVSGVTSFPINTIPLYTWTGANGLWTATGIDNRAMLSTKVISISTGLTAVDTGAQTTVGIDTAVVPAYVAASGTLNFGTINNGACAAELTFAAPGTIAGDAVAPGWPASLPGGVLGRMRITASGTAGVQLCNFSGAVVTVNATFQLTDVRSF